MGLRDILKKKGKIEDGDHVGGEDAVKDSQTPEFTFLRSDTNTQEVIHPPSSPMSMNETPGAGNYLSATDAQGSPGSSRSRRLSDALRPSRSSRGSSASSRNSNSTPGRPSAGRRLSQRLHLSRSPASSENVPDNLPEITTTTADLGVDQEGTELEWEKRATLLAKTANENELLQQAGPLSPASVEDDFTNLRIAGDSSGEDQQNGVASTPGIDKNIQEAIRLHEEGDLRQSTRLFGVLADPNGANNPLSQVLYGLALRHGWGCKPEPERAVFFLSSAAKNAADVESLALQAGLKKGGAAKGELVLAIFELANCFRHGWGIESDPLAAKQYYETAANLGDTDAMNEVAWCYLEGFGCKKNKYAAAKYYRLAEKNGNKTLGNSW
ncbi:hypothetical protein BD289DRAFT_226199 [Coniella lustricola]|uniref:HCP-like protein n=1 Tax=Coniella lustricola TaxID=2025994 RepID=A0A2T3AAT8_9PEZI|nr:hypothetical protein BD289DRAFT_226199 [Coniella lustricola]